MKCNSCANKSGIQRKTNYSAMVSANVYKKPPNATCMSCYKAGTHENCKKGNKKK